MKIEDYWQNLMNKFKSSEVILLNYEKNKNICENESQLFEGVSTLDNWLRNQNVPFELIYSKAKKTKEYLKVKNYFIY